MNTKWLASCAFTALLAGCGSGNGGGGETWVDTGSGDCQESQLAEARQNQEMFNMIGTGACTKHGMGSFAGDLRCTGSTEDGTRKLEAKCTGKSS